MEVRGYIAKYGHDEIRLFVWFKSHGVDLHDVVEVMRVHADQNTEFKDGHDFCHEILKEAQLREIERLFGYRPGNIVPPEVKISLWHWILNLFRRMAIGMLRLLNLR